MRASEGYNRTSLVFHWITVLAVIVLFLTHEAPADSSGMAFHIGGGAIIGLFLLWRVARRLLRGFADKPEQPKGYNVVASLVLWGFLGSLVIVVLTGYLLPWSHGHELEIYGLSIASPLPGMHRIHSVLETAHNITGHLFIPLLILHVLGALKHAIIDKDNIASRVFKSIKGGR